MQTKHEQNAMRREASHLYAKGIKNMDACPLKLASLRFKKETI